VLLCSNNVFSIVTIDKGYIWVRVVSQCVSMDLNGFQELFICVSCLFIGRYASSCSDQFCYP